MKRPLKIGYSPLTDSIFAGRSVNEKKQAWTGEKENITAEVRKLFKIPDDVRIDVWAQLAFEAIQAKEPTP